MERSAFAGSKECQASDWKAAHKPQCQQLCQQMAKEKQIAGQSAGLGAQRKVAVMHKQLLHTVLDVRIVHLC